MIRKLLQKIWTHPLFEDADLRRYLGKGSGGTFLIQVFTLGLTFLLSLALARILGADEFGKYTYVLAWLAVATNAFSLGMDDLALREVPALTSSGQKEKLRAFFSYAIRGTILAIFAGLVAGFFYLYGIGGPEEGSLQSYFLPVLLAMPFTVLILLFQGFLRGGQHVLSGQIPEKIIRPGLILLFSVVFYFFLIETTESAVPFLWIVWGSILTAFFVSLWFFLKKFGYVLRKEVQASGPAIKGWNRQLVYFFLLSLIAIINARIDVLMLGGLGYLEKTGIYNIAVKLIELPLVILLILNTVAAPLYARFQQEAQREKMQKLFTLITRTAFLLSLPVFILLVTLRIPLLEIFGPEFTEGSPALLILCLAQAVSLTVGPAAYALMMLGHGREVTRILVVLFVLAITLQWALIPAFGMAGAAIGRSSIVVLGAFLYGRLIWKKEKIRPGL